MAISVMFTETHQDVGTNRQVKSHENAVDRFPTFSKNSALGTSHT